MILLGTGNMHCVVFLEKLYRITNYSSSNSSDRGGAGQGEVSSVRFPLTSQPPFKGEEVVKPQSVRGDGVPVTENS
jgi:hypothetical protein